MPKLVSSDNNRMIFCFDEGRLNNEYCVLGNNICWKEQNSNKIYVIEVTQYAKTEATKTIDISAFVGEKTELVAMTAVNPHALVRVSQVTQLD